MTARRRRSVPAIIAIGLAAVGMAAEPGRGDDCLSKPNGPSPAGSHWYYRVDRATHQQCWYLGAEGTKARQQAREKAAPARSPTSKAVAPASAPPTPESAAAEAAPAASPLAPAANTVTEAFAAQNVAPSDPSASGPDLAPRVAAADAASLVTSNTADDQSKEAQDEMPLIWPVLTPQDLAAAEQAAPSTIPFAQLAAALMAVLGLAALIVRMVFMLTVGRARRKVGGRARSAVRRETTRAVNPIRDAADVEANVRLLLHQLRRHDQHRQPDFELPSRHAMA